MASITPAQNYYQVFQSLEQREKTPDWAKKLFEQRKPVTVKEIRQMFDDFELCVQTIMMVRNISQPYAQSEYFAFMDDRYPEKTKPPRPQDTWDLHGQSL